MTAAGSAAAGDSGRGGSLATWPREAVSVFGAGLYDAVALHRCVFFLARSEVIRYRTLQCFMLNGVIFLGSILAFQWVIEPSLAVLRRLVQDEEQLDVPDLVGASVSMFGVLYKVLWIYPIYCISFILSMVMYQEIADCAFACLPQNKPQKASPALERMVDEAYRMLMNFMYIIWMYLLIYVPYVGPLLYFLHACWMASIYCFEYCWVYHRWGSNSRLDYFERHWLYFAGFGFPVTLVTYLCPRFIDTGVFAFLFPLCILTAIIAEPRPLERCPLRLRHVPVFYVAESASRFALRRFEGRLSAARLSGQPATASGALGGAARGQALRPHSSGSAR